jgi:hypothetical protein
MTSNTLTYRLARRITLACLAIVIFVTAATAGATPAPAPRSNPNFATIDAYVAAQMCDLRIPGLVLGPALLQLIGMIWALIRVRQWWANPSRRPHGRRGIARHTILLALPDIGSVALASGILALGWSILGVILTFHALRQPDIPHRLGAPVQA